MCVCVCAPMGACVGVHVCVRVSMGVFVCVCVLVRDSDTLEQRTETLTGESGKNEKLRACFFQQEETERKKGCWNRKAKLGRG